MEEDLLERGVEDMFEERRRVASEEVMSWVITAILGGQVGRVMYEV